MSTASILGFGTIVGGIELQFKLQIGHTRPAIRAISGAALSVLLVASGVSARATADRLVQGLVRTELESHPNGITPQIFRFDPGGDSKALGLVGAVRIAFPGSDPHARISYYVFNDTGSAITYDNRHLALPIHTGKLIAYPPLAQCNTLPDGGYCEMVVQDLSVAIVTTTSAPMDQGSIPLMGLAFKHLFTVEGALERPAPSPVVGGLSACHLLDPRDVEEALGGSGAMPQADRIGGCSWMSRQGGLTVQPKNGGRSQFEFDRSRTIGATQQDGIGDEAFAFRSLAGFVQISFVKGNRYVIVIFQPQGGEDPMPVARQLARKISMRI